MNPKCPKCKKGTIVYLKSFFYAFCKECDFQFKGNWEEFLEAYE